MGPLTDEEVARRVNDLTKRLRRGNSSMREVGTLNMFKLVARVSILLGLGSAATWLLAWIIAAMSQASTVPSSRGFARFDTVVSNEFTRTELEVYCYGLPYKCLSHSIETNFLVLRDPRSGTALYEQNRAVRHAFEIGSGSKSIKIGYKTIPNNFIINSMLWTTVFAILICGPNAIVKWRRKRAGCCISCGYLTRGIRGGVCPECGQPIRPDCVVP
jgi:hypothetical protein